MMTTNNVRKAVTLAVLVLLSVGVAAAMLLQLMHKEGGIFDAGFRTKYELKSLELNGDEIIKGLPSTTVNLTGETETRTAEDPIGMLEDAGTLVAKAANDEKSDVAQQVTNIHYSTAQPTKGPIYSFQFNTSTPVDYNDDTYKKNVDAFAKLIRSKAYSNIDFRSTPSPDGGRSYSVKTTLRETENDKAEPLQEGFNRALFSVSGVQDDKGNISKVETNIGATAVAAEFFDTKTLNEAMNLDAKIFKMVSTVNDPSASENIKEVIYTNSPISADNSTMSITYNKETSASRYEALKKSAIGQLTSLGALPALWSTVIQVDGNPELTTLQFGTSVDW